jgi:hypothetical protein
VSGDTKCHAISQPRCGDDVMPQAQWKTILQRRNAWCLLIFNAFPVCSFSACSFSASSFCPGRPLTERDARFDLDKRVLQGKAALPPPGPALFSNSRARLRECERSVAVAILFGFQHSVSSLSVLIHFWTRALASSAIAATRHPHRAPRAFATHGPASLRSGSADNRRLPLLEGLRPGGAEGGRC